MSLRWRLALLLAAMTAVAITLAALSAYIATDRELTSEVDKFLIDRGEQLIASGPAFGEDDPIRAPTVGDQEVELAGFDASIQYLPPGSGVVPRPLTGTDVLPPDDLDWAIAGGRPSTRIREVTFAGTSYRVHTLPLTAGGAVQIARDLTENDAVLEGLRRRYAVIGLVGTAIAAIIGWLLALAITRPIERLTETAERIAETEQLAADVPKDATGEVGRLATAFTTMVETLEQSRAEQRQLVQNASHELKTPITSLRTNVEFLRRVDQLPEGDREVILADVNEELTELTDLIDELVVLASGEDAIEGQPVEVNLDELVESVVERARRRYGRDFLLVTEPSTVTGHPRLIERAVSNLVENAQKFSPSDEPIEIEVGEGGRVIVRDHGPGIPERERTQVFERFYRSDEARTLPGAGLGLAMVRQIASSHGGSISLESTPGGGATMVLELAPAG